MADLDDFFAKKDRKKSKAVKKFATADELAKKLEDTKQKTETRPKKERPAQDGEEAGKTGEEEEWKEYEEPVKDYTGLKIQVLQGGNGAPEAGRDATAEDPAMDSTKTKEKGPWNKPKTAESESAAAPAPVEAPQSSAREVRPSAYVPPASRLRAADTAQRRHHAKNAPDIHNDDYFPVLGAAGRGRAAAGARARQPLHLAAGRQLACR